MGSAMHFARFHALHTRKRGVIESWQEEQLRLLLPYLAKNITLYKKLLEAHKIDLANINSIADMCRLPITNKETFLGHFVEEYTDNSVPLTGRWVATSGTSGIPFSPLCRAHVHEAPYADSLGYRSLLWEKPRQINIDWARVAHIRVFPRHRKNHLFVSIREFLDNRGSAIQKLVDFQPDIIASHASLFFELAQHVQSNDVPLKPKYVVSGSEQLSSEVREFIEKALCCRAYDRYGLEEFGIVGADCKIHDGFHVHVESLIVEIVDENGSSMPEGEQGRILVTDLFNNQMPFVRYDTGDTGHISWEQCKCGLWAQRLWVEGRHSVFLRFRNQRFHHFEFSAILEAFMNHILQYQIVKLNDGAIAIRVVPSATFKDETAHAIKRVISVLVGDGVDIEIKRVATISRTPGGKVHIITDESTTRDI